MLSRERDNRVIDRERQKITAALSLAVKKETKMKKKKCKQTNVILRVWSKTETLWSSMMRRTKKDSPRLPLPNGAASNEKKSVFLAREGRRRNKAKVLIYGREPKNGHFCLIFVGLFKVEGFLAIWERKKGPWDGTLL